MCHCLCDVELSNSHFLLYCPTFTNEGQILNDSNQKYLANTDPTLINTLLFSDASFDRPSNTQVFNGTTEYILPTKRLEEPLS